MYARKPVLLDVVMDDIILAVEFLHNNGLVHVSISFGSSFYLKSFQKDVPPANIMIDQNGREILIDFGECFPEGHSEVKFHTPGFTDGGKISKKERDFHNLELIPKWIADVLDQQRRSDNV